MKARLAKTKMRWHLGGERVDVDAAASVVVAAAVVCKGESGVPSAPQFQKPPRNVRPL